MSFHTLPKLLWILNGMVKNHLNYRKFGLVLKCTDGGFGSGLEHCEDHWQMKTQHNPLVERQWTREMSVHERKYDTTVYYCTNRHLISSYALYIWFEMPLEKGPNYRVGYIALKCDFNKQRSNKRQYTITITYILIYIHKQNSSFGVNI